MCSSVYIVPLALFLDPTIASFLKPDHVLPLSPMYHCPLAPCRQYMQNLYQIVSVYALFVAISLILLRSRSEFLASQLHAACAQHESVLQPEPAMAVQPAAAGRADVPEPCVLVALYAGDHAVAGGVLPAAAGLWRSVECTAVPAVS